MQKDEGIIAANLSVNKWFEDLKNLPTTMFPRGRGVHEQFYFILSWKRSIKRVPCYRSDHNLQLSFIVMICQISQVFFTCVRKPKKDIVYHKY